MGAVVRITTIGNSAGIVLSKELMAKLHLEKGDQLYVTETPNGFELTPYDEEFSRQMDSARRVMRKHRDVLRKLAE